MQSASRRRQKSDQTSGISLSRGVDGGAGRNNRQCWGRGHIRRVQRVGNDPTAEQPSSTHAMARSEQWRHGHMTNR